MTPNELSGLLLRDEYLVVDIPAKEFPSLEPSIGTRAYTYWPAVGRLTVKRTTQMHGAVASWANELIAEGVEKGAFNRGDVDPIAEGRLRGFTGEYENVTKVPDMALFPGERSWPTIAFEFGYAETEAHLRRDVKLLLEGSEGKIKKAILIKLEPLKAEQTSIQDGYVEVWGLKDGVASKEGRKRYLYPPPRWHGAQKINLSLGDILGDEFENLANDGWDKAKKLSLRFDALRKSIDKATRRHLIHQGVLEEN